MADLSCEGFRGLRHSCLLSRKQAAAYLGVCMRTIQQWDSGRNRVQWSVVRLLRLVRMGDFGALSEEWMGWTLTDALIYSPAGGIIATSPKESHPDEAAVVRLVEF